MMHIFPIVLQNLSPVSLSSDIKKKKIVKPAWQQKDFH